MTYQREVRLGLVLYGGVSLAVYENGVAQEIYRAIRGDGVYGLIAKLIDSDIVVDIISGTSAGGVNGIILAYALANGLNFGPSSQLWLDAGDIQSLMRKKNDTEAASLLDSVYYQEQLEHCFAKTMPVDRNPPAIEELDLFVTSTDAHGALSTVFDDLGHAIDIKNHRALFKLTFRATRDRDDLRGAAPADLAKLSRMTSCFPVAFKPVAVEEGEAHQRWGKLRAPAIFMDGGLLNNKPFTSTISAIASRTATREVERFLIYVEPNPEQFKPCPGPPAVPTVVQAAFSSLVSIPGYQSIAGDLQEIEAHNERAARLVKILESFPDARPATWAELSRVEVLGPGNADPTAYETARLIQMRDAIVKGVLDDEKGRGYFPSEEVCTGAAKVGGSPAAAQDKDARRSGRLLVQSFDAWAGDWRGTLRQYDIFFRMRRVTHLMHTLSRDTKTGVTAPPAVWEAVNHSFKLYEIAKAAMLGWLAQEDYGWRSLSARYEDLDTQPKEKQEETLQKIAAGVWGEVNARMQRLLRAGIMVPAEPAAEARQRFYDQLAAWLTKPIVATAQAQRDLLDAIDDGLKRSLQALGESRDEATKTAAGRLRDEFCRFLAMDSELFLLQLGSGFESVDMVRVVRFSPLDAQRCLSVGTVANKVRGSTLANFGGFFKKGWRANDIMMGRLDAACLLVECLLTRERLAALAGPRAGKPMVSLYDVMKCFPNLGLGASTLANTINRYLADPVSATKADWEDLINQVVGAAHEEIQREEWPRVIACAIEQEHDWGRYRLNQAPPTVPFDPKNLAWGRFKTKPDGVIVEVAKQAIAAKMVPAFAPGSLTAQPFVEELPDTVLEELGALAAMRAEKSLLASISHASSRQRVEGSAFYGLPFRWIAPIVYSWARMRRTQPALVIVLNTMVPVICLTLIAFCLVLDLVLGVALGKRLLLMFVAIPGTVLLAWGAFFRR